MTAIQYLSTLKGIMLAVITVSWTLAFQGYIWIGAALFYGFFIWFVSSIYKKQYRVEIFTNFVGFTSLFFIPAMVMEFNKWTPTKGEIATYERLAPDMCPTYFASSGWERHVQRRNTAWCKGYPQFDPANQSAQIDGQATTASTEAVPVKATGNDLWK